MTAARKGEAGSPASSLMLKQKSMRGCSILTYRIWATVQDSGNRGMTVAEIHDQIKHVPGFDADTALWAENQKLQSRGGRIVTSIGMERIRQRVNSMRTSGSLISLGNEGSAGSTYVTGRAPKGYRRKWIPQPESGYHDIQPDKDRDASRRHIRKIQWRKEMHTELTKSRSTKKLRDLAEEALELFYE